VIQTVPCSYNSTLASQAPVARQRHDDVETEEHGTGTLSDQHQHTQLLSLSATTSYLAASIQSACPAGPEIRESSFPER